jgi:hypothetical protein
MFQYKAAIKNLKARIKTLAGEKARLRSELHMLKFDVEGKRHPETGGKRWSLRASYNEGSRLEARAALVAYGILRGVPYKAMEPSASPDKYGYRWLPGGVLSEIHQAIGDDAELKAEWTHDRVLSIILDGVDPVAQEAA